MAMLTICNTRYIVLVLCLETWRDLFMFRRFPVRTVGGGKLYAEGWRFDFSVFRLTVQRPTAHWC